MALPSTPAAVANDIVYCMVQFVLWCSIVGFMIDSFRKYRTMSTKPSLWLCVLPNTLLNIISLFCIAVVFFQAFFGLIHYPYDRTISLFFPCNLVYLQNITFICVIFLRCLHIFGRSVFRVSVTSMLLFVSSLMFSIGIYASLLLAKLKIPGTDSWVNCAVTLCVINLLFTIWMQSLFLMKLSRILGSDQDANGNDRGIKPLITKSALLSSIAMSFTILSCLFLLLRFSLFGDNPYIRAVSQWLISFNIYLNFFTNMLQHSPYSALYTKLCGRMDAKCAFCCSVMIMGEGATNLLRSMSSLPKVTVTETKTPSCASAEMTVQDTVSSSIEVTVEQQPTSD